MDFERVRRTERLVIRDSLRRCARALGYCLLLSALSGLTALVGFQVREISTGWPEVVRFTLFSAAAAVALPGLLVAGGVGLIGRGLFGETMDTAIERVPLVIAGTILLAGIVVARRTSLAIGREALAVEKDRAEAERREARTKPHYLSDPSNVERLVPRMAVVDTVKRDAFVQVLNRWLLAAFVVPPLVAVLVDLALREW